MSGREGCSCFSFCFYKFGFPREKPILYENRGPLTLFPFSSFFFFFSSFDFFLFSVSFSVSHFFLYCPELFFFWDG
jgi:hypothetical protein